MSWKGLSDYPSNFEYQFGGYSVGRFGRFPCIAAHFFISPDEEALL